MPEPRRDEDPRHGRLADEQAALRRVATLIARGVKPDELFSAVSDEVGRLFGADAVIARFEADGSAMVVVGLTAGIPVVTIGTRWKLEDFLASTAVYQTGRAARNDHAGHRNASGPVADSLRQMDFVSTVAAPIMVEGRVWGVMTVSDKRTPLPPDTEERVESFTELVATAIANADSRWALGQLADEQAALRRVAVLVGRGVSPAALFKAVSVEVAGLFGSEAGVGRFEPDGSALIVVGLSEGIRGLAVGSRVGLESFLASAEVRRTGRAARSPDSRWQRARGPIADALRESGLVSSISAPIVVQGKPWGVIAVAETRHSLPRPDAEERLGKFTELVATAIANAESRAELAASEARAHELAREQAALRRVATLVAEGVSADELFATVANEVADVLGIPVVGVHRFEADRAFTMMGIAGSTGFTVGSRWPVEDDGLAGLILATGRPARKEDYAAMAGPLGAAVRDDRMVATVGVPIVVEGDIWGFMVGAARPGKPIPPDTEDRLARFTELVATAIANSQAREHLARLADEQAALRHVATLVARRADRSEVFAAVTCEVARLFGAEAGVARFEPDGSSMTLLGISDGIRGVALGSRIPLDSFVASSEVRRSGRAVGAPDSRWRSGSGPIADALRDSGLRSTLAAPIVVYGNSWGIIGVADVRASLPPDTAERLAKFTELLATAIADAESRAALAASEARARELAKEQASLRRVATLVATAAKPEEVFAAVADEIEDLLDIEVVTICRCEFDGFAVISSRGMPGFPAGSRWPWEVPSLPGLIYRSGRPARIDDFSDAGGLNAAARDAGVRAAVGVPIIVGGISWGSICAASTKNEPFPADAEERLGRFRDLVATSISNAIMREEVVASRARIIAAADDSRRRIERDLHDGLQQRLITLAVALRRAEAKVPDALDALRADVTRVAEGLRTAVEELRELSRGIHPSGLTANGLSPALKALARRSPVRVTLDVGVEQRLSDHVEVAAYYIVSEALTNASKHANASRMWVSLRVEDQTLHLSIRDNGIGGADARRGSGLTGLRDRLEALGGKIRIESPAGAGTCIEVQIPLLQSFVRPGESDARLSPVLTQAPRG